MSKLSIPCLNKVSSGRLNRTLFQIVLASTFLTAIPAMAQTAAASLNGTVLDSSGAGVPNASLTLVNADTAQMREISSSTEGYFNFPDLASGRYTLRVKSQGFKELQIGNLVLTVGRQLTVRPVMELGLVSETVEVKSVAETVITSTAAIGTLVDTKRIQELPLNGRNALQLVALVPGVVEAGNTGQYGATQVSFRSSGGRTADLNYSLDGAINMNHFYDSAVDYPNPDALQEFQVSNRTISAAFGRGVAAISAVTKSGTQQFHGSAFEYVRNMDFDSRQFFSKVVSEFKRNQYGGSLGGPIVREKLFFFASYQGTKQRGSPGDTRYRSLTDQERSGDFSASFTPLRDPLGGLFPGNQIPVSRIKPFAAKFIQGFVPEPNSAAGFFVFTPDYKTDQNQVVTRVDYSISAKDRVMFRYFLNDTPQRGSASGSPLDRGWLAELPTRAQNATLDYTRVFTPTLLNDAKISYVRSAFGTKVGKVLSLTQLGLPVNDANSVTQYGMVPQSSVAVSGYFTADPGLAVRDIMPTTDFSDTLSWVHGRHTLQFGVEVFKNRVNQIANWLTDGTITFNGASTGIAAADMLLGRFSSYRQITPTVTRLHQVLPSVFAQDDIHVTRRLTLNLGLRWDPYVGWWSENKELSAYQPGVQSALFPNMAPGLLYPGDQGLPNSITGNRYQNFAPRVGIAWDVRGDGKTAIRASYGTYFVPLTRSISLNRFAYIQPFALDVTISGGNTDNIFAPAPFNGVNPYPRPDLTDQQGLKTVPFVAGANHTIYDLPWKTEVEHQWSASIQRSITKNSILELNYIGSSSSHLYTSAEGNPATYLPGLSTLSNTQQRRLYPQFGAISVNKDAISANYNSLQLSYNVRLSHGVTALASYAYSKALGVVAAEGEGASGPRDPNNYNLDYGPSSYDIRHVFVTSFIWQLPIARRARSLLLRTVADGWQLTGIAKLRTGTPFTVRSGLDNSFRGINNDTADLAGNWQLPDGRSKGQEILAWFNAGAFVQNAAGTYGTVGINSLRGPGFWNIDTAVSKDFHIAEQKQLQFRASFFNVLNHANLNNPQSSRTSPTFGQITSASDPRVIELGLRFAF